MTVKMAGRKRVILNRCMFSRQTDMLRSQMLISCDEMVLDLMLLCSRINV